VNISTKIKLSPIHTGYCQGAAKSNYGGEQAVVFLICHLST